MFKIQVSAYTGKGDVRQENQDRILYKVCKTSKHYYAVFMVADGCGGLAHGEAASSVTSDCVGHFWSRVEAGLLDDEIDRGGVNNLLEEIIASANAACLRYASEFGNKTGTTFSLLFVVDDRFYIKNIGDSRIYKNGLFKLHQLTKDQNLLNDVISSGKMTKKEAYKKVKKNILTMCIGYYSRAYAYTRCGRIKRKSLFLLCSDGLYNCIDVRTMKKTALSRKTKFEKRAEALRDKIPRGCAKDNVSCIIVRFV